MQWNKRGPSQKLIETNCTWLCQTLEIITCVLMFDISSQGDTLYLQWWNPRRLQSLRQWWVHRSPEGYINTFYQFELKWGESVFMCVCVFHLRGKEVNLIPEAFLFFFSDYINIQKQA